MYRYFSNDLSTPNRFHISKSDFIAQSVVKCESNLGQPSKHQGFSKSLQDRKGLCLGCIFNHKATSFRKVMTGRKGLSAEEAQLTRTRLPLCPRLNPMEKATT